MQTSLGVSRGPRGSLPLTVFPWKRRAFRTVGKRRQMFYAQKG